MKRLPDHPLDLAVILQTAHAAEGAVEAKLSAVGLSLPKLAALKTLAEAGESLPLSHLAQRLACVKSNITQLIDRLEADGFVARRPDPHDRRTKLAVLTAAGRAACDRGTRIQRQAERALWRRFTAKEAQQFAALLAKMK